jgi:hypothetical protein
MAAFSVCGDQSKQKSHLGWLSLLSFHQRKSLLFPSQLKGFPGFKSPMNKHAVSLAINQILDITVQQETLSGERILFHDFHQGLDQFIAA